MAAAIFTAIRYPAPPGNRKQGIFDFTPSTSYPAAGEPLAPTSFDMREIDGVFPAGVSATTTLHAVYDAVNAKLRLYTSSTGAEVATGSDQSANKVRLFVLGL